MGGQGSGRPRRTERTRCARHPGSRVVANGTRLTKKGLVRRYRCTPAQGDPHSLTVVVAPPDKPRRASWEPPPPCPDHPGSKVVRNGTYGKKTAKPRQPGRAGARRHPRRLHRDELDDERYQAGPSSGRSAGH